MQPTVGAELAGARRSLAALVAEHDLSADAVADVEDVISLLRRTEASWSKVLPYLQADNARIERLLARLAPLVPDDRRSELVAALDAPGSGSVSGEGGAVDVEVVNARNESLRALLSRLVSRAPGAGAGSEGRALVISCLKESLDARPW